MIKAHIEKTRIRILSPFLLGLLFYSVTNSIPISYTNCNAFCVKIGNKTRFNVCICRNYGRIRSSKRVISFTLHLNIYKKSTGPPSARTSGSRGMSRRTYHLDAPAPDRSHQSEQTRYIVQSCRPVLRLRRAHVRPHTAIPLRRRLATPPSHHTAHPLAAHPALIPSAAAVLPLARYAP